MRCWRANGSGAMEIGAHYTGQGAWTALAQIAADALALDIEEIEFPSGTSDLPDAGIAGGSAHTASAGMAIHNAGADVIARLAELATNDRRSPLFGAGNAGVRAGRLCRRDDESRGESYADILGAPDSRRSNAAEQVWPIRYHRDLGQIALRAWSRQLNGGLGHIVCAARAGHRGPAAGPSPRGDRQAAVWRTSGVHVREFPITWIA